MDDRERVYLEEMLAHIEILEDFLLGISKDTFLDDLEKQLI